MLAEDCNVCNSQFSLCAEHPTPSTNMVSSSVVYEAEGHEILIQLLSESSSITVASSAATLSNMAEQENIKSSILSLESIQALVEPLKSTDTQVLISSALCVAQLACGNTEREKVCLMIDPGLELFSCLPVIQIL